MGMTLKSLISCSLSTAASCDWGAAAGVAIWSVPSHACCCLASISSCMSLWHCCILRAALHFAFTSHCASASV